MSRKDQDVMMKISLGLKISEIWWSDLYSGKDEGGRTEMLQTCEEEKCKCNGKKVWEVGKGGYK